MRITLENFKEVKNIVPQKDHNLIYALYLDLLEINKYLEDKKINKVLYLDIQDYHNEYSPERTDPCPDYYGMYRIYVNDTDMTVGIEMTIEELDTTLCALSNFTDYVLNDKNY